MPYFCRASQSGENYRSFITHEAIAHLMFTSHDQFLVGMMNFPAILDLFSSL